MIRLTQHAMERARERQGLSPAALQRQATRAMTEGMRLEDCRGHLRRWLISGQIRHRKGAETRIFGEWVFVIQGAVLITVIALPAEFRRTVAKWRAKAAAKRAAAGSERAGDTGATPADGFKSLPNGFKAAPAVEAAAENAEAPVQGTERGGDHG